jgi:hypothetical protein
MPNRQRLPLLLRLSDTNTEVVHVIVHTLTRSCKYNLRLSCKSLASVVASATTTVGFTKLEVPTKDMNAVFPNAFVLNLAFDEASSAASAAVYLHRVTTSNPDFLRTISTVSITLKDWHASFLGPRRLPVFLAR